MTKERATAALSGQGRTKQRKGFGLAICILSASATIIASPTAKSKSDAPAKPHRWYQVGRASWYGKQFQGRPTANGERFDMNALTCAHRSLPLGTWLRVTNLVNHRSTFVRVNDRGPIIANRILDLSYAAAQKLRVAGTSKVKIEPVAPDDTTMTAALVTELIPDQNVTISDR